MKKVLYLIAFVACALPSFSQKADADSSEQSNRMLQILERDKKIVYQSGDVNLNAEIALSIPTGYKFMSKKDAEYVVFDFWGNPRQEGLLGMVVKDNYSIADPNAWAFIATYEKSGYIKDEDADEIDYDEMMTELKAGEQEENEERVKQGYSAVRLVGWTAKPYYDKQNNILHWAKSLVFGGGPDTTLNYDVRILGRKGVLSLNAVGVVGQLAEIKQHVPEIIHIAKFKEGSRYADFNPDIDAVAAYSIGGLVAGKLLAKAGILALFLKNIKLIGIGLIALFGRFGKKIIALFTGKKPEPEPASGEESAENIT